MDNSIIYRQLGLEGGLGELLREYPVIDKEVIEAVLLDQEIEKEIQAMKTMWKMNPKEWHVRDEAKKLGYPQGFVRVWIDRVTFAVRGYWPLGIRCPFAQVDWEMIDAQKALALAAKK